MASSQRKEQKMQKEQELEEGPDVLSIPIPEITSK